MARPHICFIQAQMLPWREEAARRELLEETGYYAGTLIFLAEGPLSSGASGEILSVYLARDLAFKGTGGRDETEDIQVIKIPIDTLFDHLSAFRSQGDLVDLKILGLLELAKEKMGQLIIFLDLPAGISVFRL